MIVTSRTVLDTSVGVDVGAVIVLAAAPLLLTVTIVLALAWVVRPWELQGGSWLDRLRVGEAVSNYDFWLSLRAIGGRRRRDLREELRANLWAATLRVGSRDAVRALGSTRRLAAGSTAERSGPRWGFAVAAGLTAIEVVVLVQLLVATVWADAAEAAKVSRLEGGVTLIPGMHLEFEHSAQRMAFGFSPGPVSLVVGALVFLVVARPWRLLARRPDRQPVAS